MNLDKKLPPGPFIVIMGKGHDLEIEGLEDTFEVWRKFGQKNGNFGKYLGPILQADWLLNSDLGSIPEFLEWRDSAMKTCHTGSSISSP